MEGTRDMDQKGNECHAILDSEPVLNLGQRKSQLSREVRQFLKRYDTEGSHRKRLKREKIRKMLEEMLQRSEEMLRLTEEMSRVSEAITLEALRVREQSQISIEQIEDDLREYPS